MEIDEWKFVPNGSKSCCRIWIIMLILLFSFFILDLVVTFLSVMLKWLIHVCTVSLLFLQPWWGQVFGISLQWWDSLIWWGDPYPNTQHQAAALRCSGVSNLCWQKGTCTPLSFLCFFFFLHSLFLSLFHHYLINYRVELWLKLVLKMNVSAAMSSSM